MAKSLNKVQLIGYLGHNPELKYTTSGVAVCSMSMATSSQWKDQDGNVKESTEWHNLVAWKRLAEICGEHLTKGSRAYVEGRLQTRSWDDKKSGAKKYVTEVIVESLIMLDAKRGETTDSNLPAGDRAEPERE